MRAALLHAYGQYPIIQQVPAPEPGPGEVRLRVRACGVDRFDLAIAAGLRPWAQLPLILGHEIAGEVSALGPGVVGWSLGDRAVPTLYLVCGTCDRCLAGRETICRNFRGHVGLDIAGGYAEEVVVPARNLVRIPDQISSPAAALLANVVGTALHALRARMGLGAGERVLITGAGGGVGLHAVQLARHLGADVLAVDISAERLAAAAHAGASRVVDGVSDDVAAVAREWTSGEGVDAVLELVGPATMSVSLGALAKGGRLVVTGSHTGTEWTVDPHLFYRNEWEIRGARNATVTEVNEAVELVVGGAVVPIVDMTLPLEDVADAFDRVTQRVVIGRDVLVP